MNYNSLDRFFKRYITLILVSVVLLSCETDEPDREVEVSKLVDYELISTIDADQIRLVLRFLDPTINTAIAVYDVSVYRVNYLTDFKGDEATASGLVCLPADAPAVDFPTLLGFHASISSQAESPSLFASSFGTGLEYLASLGYISVIPDYLGFGATADIPHPYLVRESVSKVSTDMVLAAEEMMEELDQAYNNELYLAGYSQGAYNAVATLSDIENNGILSEWDVKGTAAGGGTYDLELLASETLKADEYDSPQVLAFLIWSYSNYYNITTDYSEFFQSPYAERIPELFDGTQTLDQIGSQLTKSLEDLLVPSFLSALRQGDANQLQQAIIDNSISPWAISSPINFLHTPQDEVIGIINSQTYLEAVEAAGASNVTFTTLSAPSHSAAAIPMLVSSILWLQSLRAS